MNIPSNVEAIVFDIGNVLIPYDEDKIITELLKYCQEKDYEKVFKVVFRDLGVHKLFFTNFISNKEYYQKTKEMVGLEMSQKYFYELYKQVFIEPDEEMKNLFLSVKEKGLKIGILSNIDWVCFNDLMEKHSWLRKADCIVTSCTSEVLKPNKVHFDQIEEELGVNEGKILYIDDLEKNIFAAKLREWQTYLYQKHQSKY